MLSAVARKNLRRDKRVLGKSWMKTYGGYFSDLKNIRCFVNTVVPYVPDRELDVLYVASASGLLGEMIVKKLGRGRLTLLDISKKHLEQNKNPKTEKICGDLLALRLRKRFDLILMRSSLDYFPSKNLQVRVLKIIRNHLKPDGLFINQPAFIPNIERRDLVSSVYIQTKKIGDRWFQSDDIRQIYAKAGFRMVRKIGDGASLVLTEKDHKNRYGLVQKDIDEIRQIFEAGGCSDAVTRKGYRLVFEFPIFLARR